jgi:hypothetical protein
MAKYLISFPSAAMVVPDGELEAVGRDAHAVIEEAKAAGVYVFAGGIDEAVLPVLVSADGTAAMGGYPWAPTLDGGFTVLELPSRDEALRGPRVSPRPVDATRNYASSGSIHGPRGTTDIARPHRANLLGPSPRSRSSGTWYAGSE